MKTLDFDKIIIVPQYRKRPKISDPKPVLGFDTETHNGKVFLLCDSEGNYVSSDKLEDYLKFLVNKRYRGKLNFFWNIDYDFFAIIKHLPKRDLEKLYYLQKLTIGKYRIRYIPGKFFGITSSKNACHYYDLFQFFRCSLNTASKKYLGEEKIDIDVSKFRNKAWIEKHFNEILAYCKKDAWLTKRLGEYLQNLFLKADMDFNKPISCASISARYFRQITNIPKFRNKDAQRYAFFAYHGGRFETFKRGYFEQVYKYDLNSAYPYEIANLIDINKGKWYYSKKVLPDAYYGFIRCRISTRDRYIQPLPFRKQGVVYFPRMSKQERYITLEEYRFLVENDLANVKVIDGWFYYPDKIVYPFRKIKELYALRRKLKQERNDLEKVYKIVMNSLYGKFLELKRSFTPVKKIEYGKSYLMLEHQNKKEIYEVKYKAGNLFLPIYGAIITANVRLKLLETVLKKEDGVIAFYTDSIVMTEKGIKTSDKLGEFKYEGSFEAVILGNGVYSLRDGNKIVTKLRGFKFTTDFNLFKVLEENARKKVIDLMQYKVIKLGEVLNHPLQLDFNDFNEFKYIDKTLNVNFDSKRKWNDSFRNCADVLRRQIDSKPLFFCGLLPLQSFT